MSQLNDQVQDDRIFNTNDQSSLSNPLMAISTSIHLDWLLDFELKIIRGTCSHSIEILKADTETVDFDSSNLNIESATIDGRDALFIIADADPQLGSKNKKNPQLGEWLRFQLSDRSLSQIFDSRSFRR
jgi:aminopeptidase N